MIPGAGAIPDLLNAAVSAMRGDWIGAALSVFSAVPAVGDVAGAAKIAKNSEKYAQALKIVETKVLPKLPDKIRKPLEDFINKAKAKLDEMLKSSSKDNQKANSKSNDKPNDEKNSKKDDKENNKKENNNADNGKVKPKKVRKSNCGKNRKDRGILPKECCELTPYNELECEPGFDKHHVIPDFMMRTGNRGGSGGRVDDKITLKNGLSICLEKADHDVLHLSDRDIEAAGKKSTVPGTMPGKDAKKINSKHVSKASGCSEEEIKKQLDEIYKDDSTLRAIKDARSVTDEVKNAVRPDVKRK